MVLSQRYVMFCALFGVACSVSLGSGSVVTERVLKDHGWTYSQRVFPVSPKNLRTVTNGFPCAAVYLTYEESGLQDQLIALPPFPDACKVVKKLLAAGERYGGNLIAYQTSHLREIETSEDGASAVSLSCRSFLHFPLPTGGVVTFESSHPKLCPTMK